MVKPVIIVPGKNGQLASELYLIASIHSQFQWFFFDKAQLNITDQSSIQTIFQQYNPSYFINCAAYTAVDKAESDQQAALAVNSNAVEYIAKCCNEYKATLIHISTDYVFNGNGKIPYQETDQTDPVNYYGYTKWLGEQQALKNCTHSIIIRTSWVYSSFGHNFVKTMLRLMSSKQEINVVNDQIGAPTYAADLAEAIVKILQTLQLDDKLYGIYHYSNAAEISWFDFAAEIKKQINSNCIIHPIPSSYYPTPARRPFFSLMNTNKIKEDFGVEIADWKQSLQRCIKCLNS